MHWQGEGCVTQAAAGDPEFRFGYVAFQGCTSHSGVEVE